MQLFAEAQVESGLHADEWKVLVQLIDTVEQEQGAELGTIPQE